MKPIRALIEQHLFLAGMSPALLDVLARYAMEKNFEDGAVIFREGDMANRFYLVISGNVRISSGSSGGAEVEIDTIGAGDVLGWSWLFEPGIWQFNALAVGKTSTIFFYGTPLLAECEANAALGYDLIKRVAGIAVRRLQKTREKLVQDCVRDKN